MSLVGWPGQLHERTQQVKDLQEQIASLTKQLKESAEDTARLDWQELENPNISTTGYEFTISQWGKHPGHPNDDEPWITGQGKTLRAAIDMARGVKP